MIWLILFLLFGGGAIGFFGMFWETTARILKFFEVDINEEMGSKVALAGFALFFLGLGLVFLTRGN